MKYGINGRTKTGPTPKQPMNPAGKTNPKKKNSPVPAMPTPSGIKSR